MPKCHCKTELKLKKPFKGRHNVYECPRCKCIYSFILVRMSTECSKKLYKDRAISLKEVRQKRRK